MKIVIACFISLFLTCSAYAADSGRLYWNIPNGYTDGSPVVDPAVEIGGYRVYVAQTSMGYSTPPFMNIVGGLVTETLISLPDGVYYVVLTAYDRYNIESDFSDELKITMVSGRPSPPLLRLSWKSNP